MDYETVALDDENNALVIIDQTKLPSKTEILSLTKQEDIWKAIYLLQVRGAPAIGVAAGLDLSCAKNKAECVRFTHLSKQNWFPNLSSQSFLGVEQDGWSL